MCWLRDCEVSKIIRRTQQPCDAQSVRDCKYADDVSRDAAAKAVRDVFAILGVDIDDPASVEDFREDLRFGRKLRKRADYGVLAVIGCVAVALAAALWQGIIVRIRGG